jgi:hypothetical protein
VKLLICTRTVLTGRDGWIQIKLARRCPCHSSISSAKEQIVCCWTEEQFNFRKKSPSYQGILVLIVEYGQSLGTILRRLTYNFQSWYRALVVLVLFRHAYDVTSAITKACRDLNDRSKQLSKYLYPCTNTIYFCWTHKTAGRHSSEHFLWGAPLLPTLTASNHECNQSLRRCHALRLDYIFLHSAKKTQANVSASHTGNHRFHQDH